MDQQLVRTLREQVAEILARQRREDATNGLPAMSSEDERQFARAVVSRVLDGYAREEVTAGRRPPSHEEETALAEGVHAALFGVGRLQPLLDDPMVENIDINGFDNVFIGYADGREERGQPVADSDDELVEAIRFLGENARPGRPFDDLHPTMTLALGERFRLHAIGFGLSYRPSVVIRQHILTEISLGELAAGGMLPDEVAALLDAAVLARTSMVVSGDQGAGKTTLLRALIQAIPPTERFATLETDYELMTHLQPGRSNMLALQARSGHGERTGGAALGDVSIADLVPEALRQNLTRLVVGEVRGGEAGAMFEAMQAGTGTMSTTHSHSASSVMDRLASRVAQGGVVGIDEAYRQIAHNIGLFVYVTLVDDTWRGGVRRRYVSEVRQVTGAIENRRPVTHLAYQAAGPGSPEVFHPDAALLGRLAPFRRPLPGVRRAS